MKLEGELRLVRCAVQMINIYRISELCVLAKVRGGTRESILVSRASHAVNECQRINTRRMGLESVELSKHMLL